MKTDDVIYILLLNSCAQIGDAESFKLAKKTWKIIPKHFRSNKTIENCYFDVLVKCADFLAAQVLFAKMKKKRNKLLEPNEQLNFTMK